MPQPYVIEFGPWAPDISNVATQMQAQYTATKVICSDAENVYYADGCYKNLPAPANQLQPPLGFAQPLGAFTAIDPSGSPVILVGTQGNLYSYDNSTWNSVTPGTTPTAKQWQFAQFGQSVYLVDGSTDAAFLSDGLQQIDLNGNTASLAGFCIFSASITSNVMTVTSLSTPAISIQVGMVISGIGITVGTTILSLGTGTGGTGTYNVSVTPDVTSEIMGANIPPVGNVIATVGQFLMQGDICLQWANTIYGHNGYALATGDNSTTYFTGTIPNVPLRKLSVQVHINGTLISTDNGSGMLSSVNMLGTVNYATGAIALNFVIPPALGVAIVIVYTQAFPERVWWSAIGLPTFWPAPLTNAALAFQSGYEDLEGDLGPVMAIAGYPLYAVIFQRNGITRATYQGGNVVYAFATYEWKRGLVARNALVQVSAFVYFLSDQGFFLTDGANVVPIGTAQDNSAGIDAWFWANVNKNALNAITAGYDAAKRCVMFAIPTGTNTVADTLLIFNPIAMRWTKAAISAALVWTDTDGTRKRLGVLSPQVNFNNQTQYQLLTGPSLPGYLETSDVFFVDGNRRFISGARPMVNSTDQPITTIGNRASLQDPVSYTAGAMPDPFSKIAPCLSGGIYTRARVAVKNATSIHGVTLYTEQEGQM